MKRSRKLIWLVGAMLLFLVELALGTGSRGGAAFFAGLAFVLALREWARLGGQTGRVSPPAT